MNAKRSSSVTIACTKSAKSSFLQGQLLRFHRPRVPHQLPDFGVEIDSQGHFWLSRTTTTIQHHRAGQSDRRADTRVRKSHETRPMLATLSETGELSCRRRISASTSTNRQSLTGMITAIYNSNSASPRAVLAPQSTSVNSAAVMAVKVQRKSRWAGESGELSIWLVRMLTWRCPSSIRLSQKNMHINVPPNNSNSNNPRTLAMMINTSPIGFSNVRPR